MALTINGFGTKFYGKADVWPDGSFIKTKWVVALYIPVIPLGSYRVLSKGFVVSRGDVSLGLSLVKVPLHWRQVITSYAVTAAILLGFPALLHLLTGR